MGRALTRGRAFAAAWTAAMIGLASVGEPLTHDEAQYALGAANLLGRGWSAYPIHRPVGMQLLAVPGVVLGEWAMRATAVALTAAFVAAAWAFARRAWGRPVAGWTAAIVASSFVVLRQGHELLPDYASGALVLLFATILVGELGGARDVVGPPGRGEPARWRLAWLGPIAGAAFYVRYGAIGLLGALAASAMIVWRRRLAANVAPLAVAAILAAAAAVPHVLHARAATGSALGILREASLMAGRVYTGDGLVFYASGWWQWLGPAAAACVAAGLVAAAARRSAATAFGGLASIIAIVVLGLDAHGEARYVLVPEVLLVGAGVDAIRAWAVPRPRAATALVGACLAATTAWCVPLLLQARRTSAAVVAAAAVVRREAGGGRCQVLSRRWTQAAWYSGCAGIPPDGAITAATFDPAGGAAFVVKFASPTDLDPGGLDDAIAGRGGVRAELRAHLDGGGGAWGAADVYRVWIDRGTARAP